MARWGILENAANWKMSLAKNRFEPRGRIWIVHPYLMARKKRCMVSMHMIKKKRNINMLFNIKTFTSNFLSHSKKKIHSPSLTSL